MKLFVLTTPIKFSLEEAIAYIDDDELVEVTPNAIRMRKRFLDPHERKRQAKICKRLNIPIIIKYYSILAINTPKLS